MRGKANILLREAQVLLKKATHAALGETGTGTLSLPKRVKNLQRKAAKEAAGVTHGLRKKDGREPSSSSSIARRASFAPATGYTNQRETRNSRSETKHSVRTTVLYTSRVVNPRGETDLLVCV